MDKNPFVPSPATDGLPRVPCVIHHRDGGYLCLEPGNGKSAAVAVDRNIIPYRRFILQPKGQISSEGRHHVRTKAEFFRVLDQLIEKEVAIKDADTEKYLTSEQTIYGKPNADFKEGNPQFFRLGKNDKGAYYFRINDHKKELYLHKSSKTKSWTMKSKRGHNANIEIETFQVNFRKFDSGSNTNDWVIEPDESVILLDSLPAEKEQNSILFLGAVDMTSSDSILESNYHFRSVPAAWRSEKQWDEAIHSIKKQLTRENEYCIHIDDVGSKTKWIAKRASNGKLCVVIASSNFHQEHLEECLDTMDGLFVYGQLTAKDLSELGCQIQTKEIQSSEKDEEEMLENEVATEASPTFKHVEDVPISLLHRSGAWFSQISDSSRPDLLYLEPVQNDKDGKEVNSEQEIIKTTGDYFSQLRKHSEFHIKNNKEEYLYSRERKNIIGQEKKSLFRKNYLLAEYAKKLLGETPESFEFVQDPNSGGMSIMSNSKGCFLSRKRRGQFVFMTERNNSSESDRDEGTSSENEGDEWFIDAAELNSGLTSDGLLFACIMSRHGKKTIASRHAPGRPTAWRTTESWDYITGILLENITTDSSTVVTDSDTGHKWFATSSDGKELFVVVGTEGFPLHYGTKALMASEDLYQTMKKDENRLPSSSELYRVMRDIETEFRYELCFGSSEVLGLIQDVEELTDKMMANIDDLAKNIATEQDLEEKAKELNALAHQFKNRGNALKYKVAATAVAGGVVLGGICGWLIGGPAGVLFLESQMAEIAVAASVGAAPGVMRGIITLSTDQFWKRKFVNLGKCIDSRRQNRAHKKKKKELEQKRAENIEHNATRPLV